MAGFGALSARAARFFEARYGEPTPVQRAGWPVIARGRNALLVAPTGTGKTLAAFYVALDRLIRDPAALAAPGVRILYISPLKALAYDVDRNLRRPLAGLADAATGDGEPAPAPAVAVRTGDTPQAARRRQIARPPHILATTPESLYLLLGSRGRASLATADVVIVDEIHALAGEKRGAHLALSLERLAEVTGSEPQRIGLSATVAPTGAVAQFLSGTDREAEIVDASRPPALDLEIAFPPAGDGPRADAADPADSADGAGADDAADDDDAGADLPAPRGDRAGAGSNWDRIEGYLLALIRRHRQTIIFASSRALCERLARRLCDAAGARVVAPHHGSVARDERARVEEALKAGALRGLITTSSLELGIDMAGVDRVVLLESPGSVARGLQRAGRAGHRVGARSAATIVPKHRAELLECAALARGMRAGAIEPLAVPKSPLDVLAQQIVALCADAPRTPGEIGRWARRAYPYRDLGDGALRGVLEMLAGGYASSELADFRPRLRWDRARDEISALRGAATVARLGAGAIPDRGAYLVVAAADGRRVGELDEEMVFESRRGDVFALGAGTWRIRDITPDRVVVEPAPGEAAKLPFWRGEGPGRPAALGRAIGAEARRLAESPPGERERALRAEAGFRAGAARELARLTDEQSQRSAVPTDRRIVLERFRDALGDWRVCVLTPFGARVHAPWSLAVAAGAGGSALARVLHTDDGFALTLSGEDRPPDRALLVPEPTAARARAREALEGSPLFAGRFRDNALRALLIPKPPPGRRNPRWQQRQRAARLLAAAREHEDFPIVLETYRECLDDLFDLDTMDEILADAARGAIEIAEIEAAEPSPVARSLAFAYEAAYLYEQDAPLAERRAQALSVDPELLGELLGDADLRDVLDPRAVAEVEAEVSGAAEGFGLRDADDLHDALRRRGDLSEAEILARSEPGVDAAALAETLLRQGRAARVTLAGQPRWVAAEHAEGYRALAPGAGAGGPELADAIARHARGRGPFAPRAIRDRYGAGDAAIEDAVQDLVRRGALFRGAIRPGGPADEICHADVLRRVRKRTRDHLRGELAPASDAALARFLADWQGVGAPDAAPAGDAPGSGATPALDPLDPERAADAVSAAATALEGLFLPRDALFGEILPARVGIGGRRGEGGTLAAALDRAAQRDGLAWIGAPGERVALLFRDRAAAWLDPAAEGSPPRPRPAHAAVRDHLEGRGAAFLAELEDAARAAEPTIEPEEVDRAIWDLIWCGAIASDSFEPLFRPLRRPRPQAHRRTSPRARRARPAAGGRFSPSRELRSSAVADTERARVFADALLARYGIASARAAAADGLPGGFGAVYPVLREMEARGLAQRGAFASGLAGAQFAEPAAVDALRGAARREGEARILSVSAIDPAQPFGALVAWPPPTAPAAPLRRAAGARVVLAAGAPVLYSPPGGRSVWTFAAAPPGDRALAALRDAHAAARAGALEVVDGEPVTRSPLRGDLERSGFVRHYRGLTAEP